MVTGLKIGDKVQIRKGAIIRCQTRTLGDLVEHASANLAVTLVSVAVDDDDTFEAGDGHPPSPRVGWYGHDGGEWYTGARACTTIN